jgi:D-alanine-D-alanine ligase
LVEYNVAVSGASGAVKTSAIERPKATEELLDFKQKYLSGGGSKGDKLSGTKAPGQSSEGMLSLTREINPQISAKMESDIREWAALMFTAIDGTGAPRIDFIGNRESGEIWMNEVNPCPGSFGYFLWESAKGEPLLFTDLLSALIEEGLEENVKHSLPRDPVPRDARLLRRPL